MTTEDELRFKEVKDVIVAIQDRLAATEERLAKLEKKKKK